MPVNDQIDVRMVIDGKPLQEYPVPDSFITNGTNTRYVEVKPGQKFEIHVTWMAGYHVCGASHLAWKIKIDNSDRHYSKAFECNQLRHENEILTSDFTNKKNTILCRDVVQDIWKSVPLTLGVLGINDNIDDHLVYNNLDKIGSLRVQCFRATQILRETPYIPRGVEKSAIENIPESMMKGKNPKINVKYTGGEPTKPPGPRLYKYRPIDGQYGAIQEYVFLYRSRGTNSHTITIMASEKLNGTEILQSLGIIPRDPTPSPPPPGNQEHGRDPDGRDQTIKQLKRQAKEMNAQLKRMKEMLAASTGSSHENNVTTIDDDDDGDGEEDTKSTGIKCETDNTKIEVVDDDDDDDGDDEDIRAGSNPIKLEVEVPPPPPAPKVVVDLTGDDED